MKLFEDIKVVELASVLAGPSVGRFFAELGSKVFKIENPLTGGDVTRSWKTVHESDSSVSAYFSSVNIGKESVFLDLTQEKDFARLMDLLSDADVFLVNFKYGDAEKFKLDYETIHRFFPKLIYAEIKGFNDDTSRVAYDLVLQAESGFMSINGEKNAQPLKMPVALIDILAGHQLKEGVLVALLERMNTNLGAKVSVSLLDAAISSLANQASNYLMTNQCPTQLGSLHPNIAPYGEIFTSNDQMLFTLAIGSDKQFNALWEAINIQHTSKEPFETNQKRVSNRTQLFEILQNRIKSLKFSEIEKLCLDQNIPFGKINSVKEVLDNHKNQHLIVEEKYQNTILKAVKQNVFIINQRKNV
ncbi:CaiB/BaiF CoA transferase family protein [Nubsella zeaxanthinifaciens]|uniref:CaiB/BaiF CoA transferase family protein n=1 Tax=Nubsella zeaxanthinifaciens TaxID=392412 RepID=UPI000DE2533D|nr:CaiB/BaiF CoA-transferase family protein [Nubsella zeaxanthinifaciens]